MTTFPTSTWECPVSQPAGLEFDPVLRRTATVGPVARVRFPYGKGVAWLATRYEDVRTVVTDRRFSRAGVLDRDFPRMTPQPVGRNEEMSVLDPPVSSRLHRFVAKAFHVRHVDRVRPKTQLLADKLADRMARHGHPADLVEHMPFQLPRYTAFAMFDIPREDHYRLRSRVAHVMSTSTVDRALVAAAKAELRAYFGELVARRRDDPGEDVLSVLAAAHDEGDYLTDHELALLSTVLLTSGHHTITYQIWNIAYTLLTHPVQLTWLRQNPEKLPQAIEELLRFVPFRQGLGIPRIATENVELGGAKIRAGDFVHVSYVAANRDPAVFGRADELDLHRAPSPHMAFGWGTHHCVGANLARMQLQVAIGTLLQRFPALHLAIPAARVQWHTGASLWRIPEALPVKW
ncbi:cytochrome P450 [Kibdelosporangium persicum]|uniref:Pentalenic acid synthase n=1 Tax=Kibdelosporangium persicum TaxID=2698649 RepID=A0ABX2F870_9PSEU|nr:cytochrome P450 [Kibdelosporangium persicum]NRN67160.1 Pentalenic acid synthase [Kibdelosporangium persicum]